jgi:hypothetical protein
MLNKYKKAEFRAMLRKPSLFVGITLCSIGLLLLIPLFKELVYNDTADSNALIIMIVTSTVAGVLAISLSKELT